VALSTDFFEKKFGSAFFCIFLLANKQTEINADENV